MRRMKTSVTEDYVDIFSKYVTIPKEWYEGSSSKAFKIDDYGTLRNMNSIFMNDHSSINFKASDYQACIGWGNSWPKQFLVGIPGYGEETTFAICNGTKKVFYFTHADAIPKSETIGDYYGSRNRACHTIEIKSDSCDLVVEMASSIIDPVDSMQHFLDVLGNSFASVHGFAAGIANLTTIDKGNINGTDATGSPKSIALSTLTNVVFTDSVR